MSDLINRQAALDTIFSEPLYKSGMKKRDADVVVPVIYEKIKSLPSAQPELIRCKDCKYNSNPPEYGNACCDTFYGMTDQMGFCHMAERREDETD